MSQRELDRNGWVVKGEQQRVGAYGQVYTVQLVGPPEQHDEHVKLFDAKTDADKESRKRAARTEKLRIERVANRVRSAQCRELISQRPKWYSAATELRKIGFSNKEISGVFGVTNYAVCKLWRTEAKIKELRK